MMKNCGRAAGVPPLLQRSFTLEIFNQKLQLPQARSENSTHSEQVSTRSRDWEKKKYNCYFLTEPLRCMSVTSSRFCPQQGLILEEWQTKMIVLSLNLRYFSHPVSFTKPPVSTRVTIQITGSRNAVYLGEVHLLLLTCNRWNWCFTLMNSNIATDRHKGKNPRSIPRIYRDHWYIRYWEQWNFEEMQTSLLDTSKKRSTFTP